MTDEIALEKLLDAVEDAINGACWYPDTDVGTAEMLIPARTIRDLSDAYERYVHPDSFEDD